jgi:23S rRNA pseudouridine955/2504/2580 synthase
VKPQTRLKMGDSVRIPPIRDLNQPRKAVGHFKDLNSLIVYEDKDLIVINKPPGMAVHGGSGVKVGIIESIRDARADLNFCELVHRLDRGTSGCLMIAKKRSYLRLLQEALRRPGSICKHYVAVVHGRWPEEKIAVDEPLLTESRASQERFTRVDRSGKPARTLFRRLAFRQDLSLIEARPLTGRTHQIRVHCRWLRCPIVGDDRYGDISADQAMPAAPKRMLLHAKRLIIPALGDRPVIHVETPLDRSFESYLESTLGFIKSI